MKRWAWVLTGLALVLLLACWAVRARATERFERSPTPELAAALQRDAYAFYSYLLTYHPSDPRTQRLVSTWNGTVVATDDFPSRSIRGSFSKEQGTLKLRVNDPDLSDAQLRGVLLHELAHSSGTEHDEEWLECFMWFCQVTTRDLGWDVTLSQPHNCKNYGVCGNECALCGFESQATHRVTRGRAVADRWGKTRAVPTRRPQRVLSGI